MTRIVLPGSFVEELPVGAILMYPADIILYGWLSCNGDAVPKSEYPFLFSLIGTTYGTTPQGHFRLPDLRGRTVVGAGQGTGLTNRVLGEADGEEQHILTLAELPQHSHLVRCSSSTGSSGSPTGKYPAASKIEPSTGQPIDTLYSLTPTTTMNEDAVDTSGLGLPHHNMQPFLVLHFIIKAV